MLREVSCIIPRNAIFEPITVFLNDMTQKPNPLTQLRDLTQSHGAMPTGQGLITGVIALSLGILCFLGVLAFHFPEYLTTPQLRQSYNVAVIRQIMLAALA
jgi:hypothetical protein